MDNLDNVIKDYLETPNTDYAIMINGEWGCGKSYYLHHDFLDLVKGIAVPGGEKGSGEYKKEKGLFSKRKGDENNKSYYPAFISLYGVSSVEDFEYKVFCGINEWAGSKLFRIASLLGSKLAGSKGIDTGKGDAREVTFIRENRVLVFDDLERISEDHIPVKEVLGLINSYAEHMQHKVLIVCNEREFLKDDEESLKSEGSKDKEETKRKEYIKYKEKSVRFTYEFIPDVGTVYDRMVESLANSSYKQYLNRNKNAILSVFGISGKKNLRTLKFYIDSFGKIYNATEKTIHRDSVVYSFMVSFMLYACESKRGITEDDLKSLDMSKYKIDTDSFFGLSHNNQQVVSEEKDYITLFRERYSSVITEFKPNESLIQYVSTGSLDTSELMKSIQSLDAEIERMEIKEEGRVYQKLARMSEVEDSEIAPSIDEMLNYVKADRYTLYDLLNIYALLLKYDYWRIGGFELTDELDEVFLAAIQRQKGKHRYNNMFEVRTPFWDSADRNQRQYEKYRKMKEAAMGINGQAKIVDDKNDGELFLSIAERGDVAKMRSYREKIDNRISIAGIDWERVMNIIKNGSNPVACELCECLIFFMSDSGFLKPDERERINSDFLPALNEYLEQKNDRIRYIYVTELKNHLTAESRWQ